MTEASRRSARSIIAWPKLMGLSAALLFKAAPVEESAISVIRCLCNDDH